MSSPLLKHVLLIILFSRHGCATSTYVSAIGARVQKGSVSVNNGAGSYKVVVTDYKRVPADIENSGLSIPFLGLKAQEKGTVIGEASINPSEAQWTKIHDQWKEGSVPLHFSAGTRTFNATATESGQLQFEHVYRRWYSYPAQLLLLVSIPVDAVILGVLIPTGILNNIFF